MCPTARNYVTYHSNNIWKNDPREEYRILHPKGTIVTQTNSPGHNVSLESRHISGVPFVGCKCKHNLYYFQHIKLKLTFKHPQVLIWNLPNTRWNANTRGSVSPCYWICIISTQVSLIVRLYKVFNLHLRKFSLSGEASTGSDLIAEGFANLCNTHRKAVSVLLQAKFIVEKNALRGFWS